MNKKKILIISAIIAVISIVGIVLATDPKPISADEEILESTIRFEKDESDPTKINTYLKMKDTSSIASFQVGIEVDMADCYDSTFDWSTGDLKGKPSLVAEPTKISEMARNEQTGNIAERINLYYVGTEDKNVLKDEYDPKEIKLGTINIVPHKDESGQEVELRTSNVSIGAIKDFSKTVSLSHESENIAVYENQRLNIKLTQKVAPTAESLNVSDETKTIIAEFELNNDSESAEKIYVELVNEQGEVVQTKELDDLQSGYKKVEFSDVNPGKYTVRVKGTYQIQDGTRYEEEAIKTTAGNALESGEIEIQETSVTPPTEASPEPSPEASPEATPEVSPEPSPEASPEATPEVSPEPSPEPSPEASPVPSPEVSPEPSVEPSVSPSPGEVTEPSPEPSVEPQQTPSSGEPAGTPGTGSEGQQGGQGSGSTENYNPYPATDPDKAGDTQSPIEKIINNFKTGGNRSIAIAVIALVILVAIAVVVWKLRKKTK